MSDNFYGLLLIMDFMKTATPQVFSGSSAVMRDQKVKGTNCGTAALAACTVCHALDYAYICM